MWRQDSSRSTAGPSMPGQSPEPLFVLTQSQLQPYKGISSAASTPTPTGGCHCCSNSTLDTKLLFSMSHVGCQKVPKKVDLGWTLGAHQVALSLPSLAGWGQRGENKMKKAPKPGQDKGS